MVRKSGKLLLVLALLLGKRGVKPERRKVVQIPIMFWVQLDVVRVTQPTTFSQVFPHNNPLVTHS